MAAESIPQHFRMGNSKGNLCTVEKKATKAKIESYDAAHLSFAQY